MFRIALVIFVAMIGCGHDGDDAVEGDPRLASLAVIADGRPLDALTPTFDPDTHEYRLNVGFALDRVQLVATPIESTTTMTVDELDVAAGAPSSLLPLPPGPTSLAVVGTSAEGSAARYTVTITRAGELTLDENLEASNAESPDYYGHAVAISGDTLAIAASRESSSAPGIDGNKADNSARGAGAVYIYTRTGTTWTLQAYIKASNPDADDQFGEAIALSGDTLVVGAPNEDSAARGINTGNQFDDSVLDSGAVYVFTRTGSTWMQMAYIKAPNPNAGAAFGAAVSIDGDTLAVGAPRDRSPTGADGDKAGAVHVFTRTGSTWSLQSYISASNAETLDKFGASVSVSGDTLAVGASGESSAALGIDGDQADNSATASGAVYVFTRAASTWSQQAYVKASNTDANDQFGSALSLSGDTLAVGAPMESSAATGIGGDEANNTAPTAGAAYVFARTGSSWSQEAYIKASNTEAQDRFGFAISLDGTVLAIGAVTESSSATGLDGDQADNAAPSSGAAYLFERTDATWSQQSYIKSSNTGAGYAFSRGISISGGTLAVGAPGERCVATDNSTSWCGAAYVFR